MTTMTDDELIENMQPIAAALNVAVERRDQERVAKILTPLTYDQLLALAIFQSSIIELRTISTARVMLQVQPIAHTVAAAGLRFGIDPQRIVDGEKRRDICEARHVSQYAAWLLGMTLVGIARYFDCHHTSVLNARVRVGEDTRLRRIATDIAIDLGYSREESVPDLSRGES